MIAYVSGACLFGLVKRSAVKQQVTYMKEDADLVFLIVIVIEHTPYRTYGAIKNKASMRCHKHARHICTQARGSIAPIFYAAKGQKAM